MQDNEPLMRALAKVRLQFEFSEHLYAAIASQRRFRADSNPASDS